MVVGVEDDHLDGVGRDRREGDLAEALHVAAELADRRPGVTPPDADVDARVAVAAARPRAAESMARRIRP